MKQLNFDRFALPSLLRSQELVGLELGVAAGNFSLKMVESGRFSVFFGIDAYADHHDTREYVDTLRLIGVTAPFKLLRMRFDEALPLFDDESLDFIYIDGYAHTGENGGHTIFHWLRKVKVGGMLAGHDYHTDWPLVVEAVDALCEATGFELLVTEVTEDGGPHDRHPSWAVVKTHSVTPTPPPALAQKAAAALSPRERQDPLAAPFPSRVRQAGRLLLGARVLHALRPVKRFLGRAKTR